MSVLLSSSEVRETYEDGLTRLRKQFEANADDFEIYIGRHGFGSAKIDLQSIALHSSNRRWEPSAIGPSGMPIFKSARISKEYIENTLKIKV